MIVMERFVFWGDIGTIQEQFQALNCIQLNVKICDVGRDGHDRLEKAEVMEDHLPKDTTVAILFKGV